MRISDWSSDVCSSDLQRCERQKIDPLGGCTTKAQRQKDRRDDQREQDRKPAVHLADKLVPFHLSFLPFVSRSARAVRRVWSGSAASRPWRHDRRVSGRGGSPSVPSADACRSEEHTSELQSLMRISYAVFCLQKKNT